MPLSFILPSVHGGHSSIDNHRPWFSGFPPEVAKQDPFLPNTCPTCPGKEWCYNLRRPPTRNEQVVSLNAIFRCYQEAAIQCRVIPFCVTVHAPFPEVLEAEFAQRRGVSDFRAAKIQMPAEDFPVFLEAVQGIPYAAVELEIFQNESYQGYYRTLIEMLKRQYPWLLRIASLHHIEIDRVLYRQGKEDLERTLEVYARLGCDQFWKVVLESTLESVSKMDIHVLGHPFGWQKRLPDKCPVNADTKRLAQEIAKVMARRNIMVDLNASGLWKGSFSDNPYFPAEWVPIFLTEGVRFSCGDDSHNQRQIGKQYDQLLTFIANNGIGKIWRPVFRSFEQEQQWESISVI